MNKKNIKKSPLLNKKKAAPILQQNQPKEFFVFQAHQRFDEIDSVLLSKCYQTEQVKKAREALSLARHFAIKACNEDSVSTWVPR